MPVQVEIDAECLADFGRSICQFSIRAVMTALAHDLNPGQRFDRPDQDSGAMALFTGHDIETMMHAVGEIDIGETGGTEHGFGARRRAGKTMTGRICLIISFRLDDATAQQRTVIQRPY